MLYISTNRVHTGQVKVREKLFFSRSRKKLGNFVKKKKSGSFYISIKFLKIRRFPMRSGRNELV